MAMLPRERIPFSAIVDRPKLALPGGARIVIWSIVNVEYWDIARPMARQVLPPPTGASLYEEGAERPKIMAIAIHPYISGQPFRIKYLEQVYESIKAFPGVLHWNGEQILDWYLKARPPAH